MKKPFEALTEIKESLRRKKLTVEEAQELAEPHLIEFNAVSTEKAKKYGVPAKLLYFRSFMRCHVWQSVQDRKDRERT